MKKAELHHEHSRRMSDRLDELLRENAQLRAQIVAAGIRENRLLRMLDASPDGVILTDLDGRIEFGNSASLSMFGYAGHESTPTGNIRDLFTLEGKKIFTTEVLPLMRSSQRWSGEIPVARADHTAFSAYLGCAVILNSAKEPSSMVISFSDVSVQRGLEEQLHQSRKMEAIGTLAGGIAHDMNNVLSAIFNLGTVMKMNSAHLGDSLKQDIDDIIYAAKRGRDLSRDLLGFARKGNFLRQRLNYNVIVEEVRKLLVRSVSHVDVQLFLDEALPLIEGDHGQLSHALMNICLNAADAINDSEYKSGMISISTETVKLAGGDLPAWPHLRPGRYVRVNIIDTGEGMDADVLTHAFDPFFTTRETDKGTGLGLSMVYGTMKSHGGAVSIKSEKGAGTHVSLLLPVSQNERTPLRHTGQFKVSRKECSGKILLVDDEQMIRRSAARLLSQLGYEILVAANAVEALEVMAHQGQYLRLAILDLVMPGMDGETTFHRLREMDAELPILISSGYSKGEKVDKLIHDGAAGFVQKPFELAIIAEQIAAHARSVTPEA